MKMDSSIRVKTDAKYASLYRQLSKSVIGDSHELFFISVCIGYKNKKKKTIGKHGEDRFWSSTISPEEWLCYYAIIVEENGMDIGSIQDDRNVIARIQEYANAGIEILIEKCLKEYISNASEDIIIDPSALKELPKILLSFIFESSLE